jgi:valyl-tRNA synthetase
MASTQAQPSAKPMAEKQRLKLEKFAKKEKQAQEALQKQQQASGTTQEKKSKKQDAPAVESKNWVEETPAGCRKILKPLDDDSHKAYLPMVVESAWYSFWENQGLFKPRTEEDGSLKPKGKYVIAIPPPNVWTNISGVWPSANAKS